MWHLHDALVIKPLLLCVATSQQQQQQQQQQKTAVSKEQSQPQGKALNDSCYENIAMKTRRSTPEQLPAHAITI